MRGLRSLKKRARVCQAELRLLRLSTETCQAADTAQLQSGSLYLGLMAVAGTMHHMGAAAAVAIGLRGPIAAVLLCSTDRLRLADVGQQLAQGLHVLDHQPCATHASTASSLSSEANDGRLYWWLKHVEPRHAAWCHFCAVSC